MISCYSFKLTGHHQVNVDGYIPDDVSGSTSVRSSILLQNAS